MPDLCVDPRYRDHLAAYDDALAPAENSRGPKDYPALPPSPDGRVRVGLLCPCLVQGGAETWQLALARHTDPRKVAWAGCCVVDEGDVVDAGMLAQTEAFMPVTRGTNAARDLASRCDVLVIWGVTGIPSILAGLPTPPKVVSACHAPPESPWGRNVYGRASGIDHWVAVSPLALDAIPEPARASIPTSVIWNAVDPSRLEVRRSREEMHETWGVPIGARVGGYLGRLSAEKDPRAMRRSLDALPRAWHCVVVGAGCEEIEPHPRLHLVGPDPAAGDVLNAFDVLVVPSAYESFGLTIAEGLWMGIPVISTRTGIAKILPNLTHAIPVDASPAELARAIWQAHHSGPRSGAKGWARTRLAPARFGREWTDLLVSLAPPPPPLKVPGFLEMAGTALKAAGRLIADGGRLSPEELRDSRLAICSTCPRMQGGACSLCGCTLQIKVRLPLESCPDNPPRWGPA
jgi:glycosyltransferase involved in cell wall biosynthesis